MEKQIFEKGPVRKLMQLWIRLEKYEYIDNLMRKAKRKFSEGNGTYTMGDTFGRILEEWAIDRGFIQKTSEETRGLSKLQLIRSDAEELAHINALIRGIERYPTMEAQRELSDYIYSVDQKWQMDKENATQSIIKKAKELFQ